MNDVLNSNFLDNVIIIIIQILTAITNVILFPINLLIDSLFPDFSSALGYINQFFDLVQQYLGWVLSFLGIPAVLVTLVLAYYLFSVTITLGVWGTKLALKWIGHFT